MRTKTFFAGLFFCIACPCYLFPEITIYQNEWRSEISRSIDSPILKQTENFITIYSNKSLESLNLEIKDFTGNIVYKTTDDILAGTTFIDITDLPSGDYTIRISQGQKYIIAYFNK
nr:DUF3244 domain-containing protein [uncultured Bacteroides sp.]